MTHSRSRRRGIADIHAIAGYTIFMVVLSGVCLLVQGCDSDDAYKERPPLSEAIHVSLRDAMLTDGAVLQLNNKTDSEITDLYIGFRNLDSKQEKGHVVDISPGQTVEVGVLECGWKIEPREEILLSAPHTGYSIVFFRTYVADDGSVGIREKRFYE